METRLATHTNVCNVLIIGSGAAGLREAIAAHQADVKALAIGKRQRLDAHTVLAAGGINAVLGTRDPEGSWQQHFADTLREGYYQSDPRVVELMAREASRAVEEPPAGGCRFARTPKGKLDQRFSELIGTAVPATSAITPGVPSPRRWPVRLRNCTSQFWKTSTYYACWSVMAFASAR